MGGGGGVAAAGAGGAFFTAISFASSLPKKVRGEVTQLKAQGVDQIVLALDGGRSVLWGDASESELKAEVLAALLTTEARVYDVSSPRTPTTRG